MLNFGGILGPSVGAQMPLEPIGAGQTDPQWKRVQDVFPSCPKTDFISLDENVRILTGYLQPIFNQEYAGLCTAAVWREARALSSAGEALRMRPYGRQSLVSAEWLYGMARTRLTKPNNAPPGTGIGDVALIAKTVGVVPCVQYPEADLRFYDPKRGIAWEKQGPPDALRKYAKAKVETLLCMTKAEVLSALFARVAVVFQAQWYFTQTDLFGVAISTGIKPPLAHAMTIQGFLRENGKEYFCVRNTMGSKIFTGKNHPKFPMRGTALVRTEEMEATVFGRGTMFAVMGN